VWKKEPPKYTVKMKPKTRKYEYLANVHANKRALPPYMRV